MASAAIASAARTVTIGALNGMSANRSKPRAALSRSLCGSAGWALEMPLLFIPPPPSIYSRPGYPQRRRTLATSQGAGFSLLLGHRRTEENRRRIFRCAAEANCDRGPPSHHLVPERGFAAKEALGIVGQNVDQIRFVASGFAGAMGSDQDVWQCPKRGFGPQRLVVEAVERRGADASVAERRQKGNLVNHFPTRDIDKEGSRLQRL